ncbi:MAG: Sel1 repeat [Holophagaceae bacterium]|nr:Sel1 repeat [Holophagaceae bacterium]
MSDPEMSAPEHPEPSPDATQRLVVGVPEDPLRTQRLERDPERRGSQASAGTVKLTREDIAASETHRVANPMAGDPPIRVQREDQPALATGQAQKLPQQPASPSRRWPIPLAIGFLVVLVAAAFLMIPRASAPQASPVEPTPLPAETTPPGAQVYLEQAKAGDAHAMRMLGVMYYYGLNVPQDREKGLYWYRQAAEKGSDAARAELSRLEAAN